jgi:hypothetical protein
MLDIPSISAIIAAAGVLIGVVLTVLEVRNLVKQRQSDLVLRLYTTFGSDEFQKRWTRFLKGDYRDYEDFTKAYNLLSGSSPELAVLFEELPTFLFESLGVLLKNGLIEMRLVDDLFTGPSKWFWEKLKPIAEDVRTKLNYPQYAEHVEYLYNEVKKREQKLQAGVRNG